MILNFSSIDRQRIFLLEILDGNYVASVFNIVSGKKEVLYTRAIERRIDHFGYYIFSQLTLNSNHRLAVFNGYRNLQDGRGAAPLIICDLIKKTVQEINPLERISNFKWSRSRTNSLYIAGAKGTDPKFNLFEYSCDINSPPSSALTKVEVEMPIILNFEIIDETTSGIRSLFVSGTRSKEETGLFRIDLAPKTEYSQIHLPPDALQNRNQGLEGLMFLGFDQKSDSLIFSTYGGYDHWGGADSDLGSMLWKLKANPLGSPRLIDLLPGGNPQVDTVLPVNVSSGILEYRQSITDENGERFFVRRLDLTTGTRRDVQIRGCRIGAFEDKNNRDLIFVSYSADNPGSLEQYDLRSGQDRTLCDNKISWATKGRLVQLERVHPSQRLSPQGIYYRSPYGQPNCPGIVYVHGGAPSFRDSEYDFNDKVQWLLLKGYDVIQVNYNGVPYGNYEKPTTLPNLYDILSGKRSLVTKGRNPEERIGIIGRSLGGYAVNAIAVFHPDWFRAQVSESGNAKVSFPPDRVGAKPEEDPSYYHEHSPLNFAQNLANPIFIAVGGKDFQVDPKEGLSFARELENKRATENGPEVRLFYKPQEDHHIGQNDPLVYIEYFSEFLKFFDKYLKQ